MNKVEKAVLLAHGDGGKLTHQLIRELFLAYFGHPALQELSDAAVITMTRDQGPAPDGLPLVVTTDSFVIDPIFFPGGDIGKLAVCGTVNDLAVSGARPLYLTCGFIIEEGFPLRDLEAVVQSMAEWARIAGAAIVAGDTKVVPRGHADKIFINTTGIGLLLPQAQLGYQRVGPGDKVLVSGSIGDHGLCVLSQRQGLGLQIGVESDCCPLTDLARDLIAQVPGVKLMRDPTRGGLATTLKEIALASQVDIQVEESELPIRREVRGGAEILGLDPLYLANEGKLVAIVAPDQASQALDIMNQYSPAQEAAIIGQVLLGRGNVYLKTAIGGTKYLDLLVGAQLPRIC